MQLKCISNEMTVEVPGQGSFPKNAPLTVGRDYEEKSGNVTNPNHWTVTDDNGETLAYPRYLFELVE